MSFISYAQNLEDVMLWRALKHIKKGFYVDVGAWLPEVDSVTKAFYDKGWHGINVEPHPDYYSQLESQRPHDINLCIAVSDTAGKDHMNVVSNSGLSTLDDAIAREHANAGFEVERKAIKTTTLAAIWEKHIGVRQSVHFLKIDVEGYEERVLRGIDWAKCRPWIVVVEATHPMSQTETHSQWEPILFDNRYTLAYQDGLNRFYVADAHKDLLPAFKQPPNIFNGYKRHAQVKAEAKANRAEQRAHKLTERQAATDARLAQQKAQLDGLRDAYQATVARLEQQAHELNTAKTHAAGLEARLPAVTAILEKVEQALASANRAHEDLQRARQEERKDASSRIAQLEEALRDTRNRATQFEIQALELRRSLSWKITAPLRTGLSAIQWLVRLPLRRRSAPKALPMPQEVAAEARRSGGDNLATLSPTARKVYRDLKLALRGRGRTKD